MCLIIVIVGAVPTLAFANFPDIYENNPYFDAIEYVKDQGIVDGYPNGLYEPWRPINRAEFVKILISTKYEAADIEACNDSSFSDVPSTEWYFHYVCLAKKMGVIDGYPDGTFQPSNEVNFAEAAKIVVNTLAGGPVRDGIAADTEWYIPYAKKLELLKAIPVEISGYNLYLDRQMMAEIIYRLDANVIDKTSLTTDEIGYTALIKSYYNKLDNKDYEGAYKMKVEPNMSLEDYTEMYKTFAFTVVSKFEKIDDAAFNFEVRTLPMDGSPTEIYNVTMKVVDGNKLKTVSTILLNYVVLEELRYGNNLVATVEWKDGAYNVYVTKNGEKTLVKSFGSTEGVALTVNNLRFSNKGEYLIFHIGGWEIGGVAVYDIENKQLSDENFLGGSLVGFSSDDEYFYFCSESGMLEGDLFVMDMPGFTVRRQLVDKDNETVSYCGPFDAENNILKYQKFTDNKMHSYEYDIENDEVEEDLSSAVTYLVRKSV